MADKRYRMIHDGETALELFEAHGKTATRHEQFEGTLAECRAEVTKRGLLVNATVAALLAETPEAAEVAKLQGEIDERAAKLARPELKAVVDLNIGKAIIER